MKSVIFDAFFLKKKNIFPSDIQAIVDMNLDLILEKNGTQTCGQITFICSLVSCLTLLK